MIKTLFIFFTLLACSVQGIAEEVGFGKEPIIERPVGALEERWQFPSDHLPMGATIDDFHIVTWNVLNAFYIDWIRRDGQGLSRSLIMQEHVFIDGSELTVRDRHVVRKLLSMIAHPTHPRTVLALQECGPAFLKELKEQLPPHLKIIRSRSETAKDQDILIYDAARFDFLELESEIANEGYSGAPGRTIMNIFLQKKEDGMKYRFIHTHVPGDPALPSRYDLADYAMDHRSPGVPTIVLGDMNFDHWEMQDAFRAAAANRGIEDPFENFAIYYSNIGIYQEAKCIDHIFVDCRSSTVAVSENRPQDVLAGLEDTVNVLYEAK